MFGAFVGRKRGRFAVVSDRRVLGRVHLDVGAEGRGRLTCVNKLGLVDVSERASLRRGRLLSMEIKRLRLGRAVTVGSEVFKD